MNYKNSGVNVQKGNEFVKNIKEICKHTGIGGFSGIYDYNGLQLVTSTDGVGSKLELCRKMNCYDTIGIDLVAMCINDILCQGGKPLFFLDYYAMNKLDIERATEIIKGIQYGCSRAGCILLGGETAEMPLVYEEDKFDLAGFVVGVIDKTIYPKETNNGDLIFGIASNGIHSNGYSLIHKLLETEEYNLEELIAPTKIYNNEIEKLKLELNGTIRGFAHITGGGILDNIHRILRKGQSFQITEKWKVPKVFQWIYNKSDMTKKEMFNTYNCGIGMVVIIDKNINKQKVINEYKLIPMGKVIQSTEEIINYDDFF